jgi:hypothetical protein
MQLTMTLPHPGGRYDAPTDGVLHLHVAQHVLAGASGVQPRVGQSGQGGAAGRTVNLVKDGLYLPCLRARERGTRTGHICPKLPTAFRFTCWRFMFDEDRHESLRFEGRLGALRETTQGWVRVRAEVRVRLHNPTPTLTPALTLTLTQCTQPDPDLHHTRHAVREDLHD